MPRFLETSARYDAFLLDLWGVIHDGTALYPGVAAALKQLKQEGKKVIFLSNAPRRASRVVEVLEQLGIDNSLYSAVVSSGEVGYLWLKGGHAPWGKRYLYIGPEKDLHVLDGLDFQQVHSVEEADFVLNVGFGTEAQSSEDVAPLLCDAFARTLPMLCLNPDMEVVKITGERFACAGVLAKSYVEMGGEVVSFGKPYGAVYEYCFGLLPGMPKNKILAVGDSLDTDIRGGLSAGLDSMLVTGGILKHHSAEALAALCTEAALNPTYIVPQLG